MRPETASSMRPLLSGWRPVLGGTAERFVLIGQRVRRRGPLISLLLHLPWLRLPLLQAEIAARVGRAAKPDLVPGVGMRVVGVDGVLNEQEPATRHRRLTPDVITCRWVGIMHRHQHLIL